MKKYHNTLPCANTTWCATPAAKYGGVASLGNSGWEWCDYLSVVKNCKLKLGEGGLLKCKLSDRY